eukprot:m.147676 g.147676  ORF g.147676 m.147676 type:complete len:680 (-) comp17293_c0_seq7:65-2104(-)
MSSGVPPISVELVAAQDETPPSSPTPPPDSSAFGHEPLTNGKQKSKKGRWSARNSRSMLSSSAASVEPVAHLCIIAHSAKHLLPKDISGTSDPFLRVVLDGKVVAATKTLRADLNPVWNEEFILPLYEAPQPDSLTPLLKIEVLNEYKFGKVANQLQNVGKAGFLGQIVLPVGKLCDRSFLESKRWYELQKRSSKSHVRGSVQLTMYIDFKDKSAPAVSESLEAWSPRAGGRRSSLVPPTGEQSTDFSVGMLSEFTKSVSQSLEPGTYTLFVQFIKASEMPQIDSPQNVSVLFQAETGKAKQRVDRVDSVLIEDSGTLPLNNETVSLPVKVSHGRSPMVKLSVSLPRHGTITRVFSDLSLGRAQVPLLSVPVLDSDDSTGVEGLPAIDLYLEKPSLTPMPLYVHVRDSRSGSVCRLRVKMWLNRSTSVACEDDDNDDENPELVADLPPPYQWEMIAEDFKVPIDRLHDVIFGDNVLMDKFSQAKGYTQYNITPWVDNKRQFTYMIPSSRFVKANKATEEQEYKLKRPGQVYVVNVDTTTPDVPYGSDFKTVVQYMLTSPDKGMTRLLISAEVVFSKSPMIKGMITKAAKSGMQDTFSLFTKVLREHLNSTGTPVALVAPKAVHAPAQSSWSAGGGGSALAIIAAVEFVLLLFFFVLWLRASAYHDVVNQMLDKLRPCEQ